jgi:phosphohistidine phosphatase
LSGLHDTVDEVLLVGHNPGLTELANRLLPSLELRNLPTAGAVAIACATDRWADFECAERELLFYDYPKNERVSARDGTQSTSQKQ